MRVPEEILTNTVMEDIKARCCFVGEMMETEDHPTATAAHVDDGSTEPEVPPSDSSFPEADSGVNSPASPPSSRLSSVTSPSGFSALTQALSQADTMAGNRTDRNTGERHLQAISEMYSRHSTATDINLRVEPPPGQATGTGRGTLRIPGWVRERAAEVLFDSGDVDESSVAEVILETLLRVPVDLRRTLASSILVVGGTPMLPGFIPRLQDELVRLLERSPPARQSTRPDRPPIPVHDPYAPLRPLAPYVAILNNPSPPPSIDANIPSNAGKAPAFTPAMLPWVGGSLAGYVSFYSLSSSLTLDPSYRALKISGMEISREKWDETATEEEFIDEETEEVVVTTIPAKRNAFHLPDWTRAPLPPGAPAAPRPPRPTPLEPSTP
jgi:actin-related protein 10